VKICTEGDVCPTRGSKDVLVWCQDMGRDDVTFSSMGCTGNCKEGPNALFKGAAGGKAVPVGGLTSVRAVANALDSCCDIQLDPDVIQCSDFRMQGVRNAMNGDFETAIALFSKAIDTLGEEHPMAYLFYANRAVARLKNRDKTAMEDGEKALALSPEGWADGWPYNTDLSGLLTEF